jgi:hypothetical protein
MDYSDLLNKEAIPKLLGLLQGPKGSLKGNISSVLRRTSNHIRIREDMTILEELLIRLHLKNKEMLLLRYVLN